MRELGMLLFLHISPQQEAINSQLVDFLPEKVFHSSEGFAKCSVNEWIDGCLDKFAAVGTSDEEMIAFWVCSDTLLFVNRRTL